MMLMFPRVDSFETVNGISTEHPYIYPHAMADAGGWRVYLTNLSVCIVYVVDHYCRTNNQNKR